jgi:hypothetical protein
MIELKSTADVDAAFSRSSSGLVLIFKHSLAALERELGAARHS